jgi:hypothetical protein
MILILDLVFTQVFVPQVKLIEPDTVELQMFIVGVLYFKPHFWWWYRSVPKHVGFIHELLQAIKVHAHVLVCCFAILLVSTKWFQ